MTITSAGTRQPIRLMAEDLSLKIAAGEVVERPASVVKELIDNALDAGATTIRIDVQDAGLRLIRVSDDGQGIRRGELSLAFTSHATSKICRLEDLENLSSLGFRGEALPSIAAVARVEVQTRAEDEEVGSRFVVDFGKEVFYGSFGAPLGTRIAVRDLFANVPARRKFVRSLRSENNQIQQTASQMALAEPGVSFQLSLDDRLTFHSPGTGMLEDALLAVFGPPIMEHMRPVAGEADGIEVRGMISLPTLTRQNRSSINIFVNGRPIQNRSLVFALEEAYRGYVMTGRHPVAAVHLRLHPAEIDANIHPSKSEVRFERDRHVHGALHRAVSSALLSERAGNPQETELEEPPEPWSAPSALRLPFAPNGTESEPIDTADTGVPALRVFGQANQMFIIAEGPNGLYMIDQHAAHERILFDRLDQQQQASETQSQQLLDPLTLDLSAEQMMALETNHLVLKGLGFELEPFGNSACLIRALPSIARGGSASDLVGEVLDELRGSTEPVAARDRALAMTACKAAVKAGDSLDLQEMRELVTQLEKTGRPATCPHGRPTMIHLSNSLLERQFGRQ